MEQNTTYEGMFVLEPGNPDFEQASEPVRTVLERSGAEILLCKAWDDRRLAYEIDGKRRGLYVLTYFRAEADRIREIEHDCQLSEQVLRVLILQRGSLTPEAMEEEATRTANPGESGGRGDRDRDRDRGGRGRDRSDDRSRSKPDAKAAAKPDAKPEGDDKAKEKAEGEGKPEPKGQDDAKPEAKPEGEPEGQDDAKAEPKPEAESSAPDQQQPQAEGKEPEANRE